ncbi:hypothetical protein ANN_03470 [Periplaneta americana]|uniref:RNase H type-1 domain-containing protein n=1 Tax=Periplaneta americana TaxID=6978 RepID=A0ABQ8U0W2_PERAM|nr:hypothetical protein ANN_03470 [Periplaneta americana]
MCDAVINTYKPVLKFWFGPIPGVGVTDPDYVEAVLNNTKMIEKGAVYKLFSPWLGTGLLTSTGQKWHSRRKIITPSFHFKILENFIPMFAECCDILVNRLRKEVGREVFDVYPYISACSLDIICESAMGTSVYAQKFNDSDYIKAVYKSLGYGTTSFDGEIIAISECLRNVLCHINKFRNAVILSDSKAAILSIVSKHTPSSQTAEITKMLSQLISLNKRIIFQWIPSHCGILGNENEDALAKKGSTASYRPVTKSTYKLTAANHTPFLESVEYRNRNKSFAQVVSEGGQSNDRSGESID